MRNGPNFKIGNQDVFWCEKPLESLRWVGFADKCLRSVKHDGWYLDDEGDSREVARGVVYRLPARAGQERFMYGVADPFSDGPAIVAVDLVADKDNAARWADQLAERYAESERDYRRVNNAGVRYRELEDEISQTRRVLLLLLSTRRTGDMALGGDNLILMEVKKGRREIKKMRRERARLFSDYGMLPAFNEG